MASQTKCTWEKISVRFARRNFAQIKGGGGLLRGGYNEVGCIGARCSLDAIGQNPCYLLRAAVAALLNGSEAGAAAQAAPRAKRARNNIPFMP